MGRWGGALVMAAVTVSMSGCVSGYGSGPDVAGYTQTGVVIRYDPSETSADEVLEEAQSHCDHFDLKAVSRGAATFLAEARYQGFDCVSPSSVLTNGALTQPAETAAVTAVVVAVPNPPGLPDPPPMTEGASSFVIPDGEIAPDATSESVSPEAH